MRECNKATGAREIVAVSEGDAPPEVFLEALSAPAAMPYVRESHLLKQIAKTDVHAPA